MAKLLVTGDSITAASYVTEEETYGRRIKDYYNFSDYVNTAVPGWTSGTMLQYIQDRILTHNPDSVIIMLGTNDMARGCDNKQENSVVVTSYINNMSSIIDKCKAQNIKLTIISPPITKNYYQIERIREMSQALKNLCVNKGVTFVDMFNYLVNKTTHWDPKAIEAWYYDTYHLNKTGHEFVYFILTKYKI
jgi:lysophospholipase L1-like esterase